MTSSHRFISAVPAILLSASFLFASVDTNAADSTDFTGLGFGVGLSLTVDTGSNDRVKSASLVNGIVRVQDEDNAIARIMFESHYFFDPKGAMPITGVESTRWGYGPFIAVQSGSDDIIDSIGLGFMLGFKRRDADDTDTSSWNIGIGYVVDPNAQILGDGVKANSALPNGETEIRFKEKAQGGLLLITSFSW